MLYNLEEYHCFISKLTKQTNLSTKQRGIDKDNKNYQVITTSAVQF